MPSNRLSCDTRAGRLDRGKEKVGSVSTPTLRGVEATLTDGEVKDEDDREGE